MQIKKKDIQASLILFLVLFLIGLKFSYNQISAQNYWPQHMYNLAISLAINQINKIMAVGLVVCLVIFISVLAIRLFWQKHLSRIFKIRIEIDRALLLASLRVFSIIVILVDGGVAVFRFLVSPGGVARDEVLVLFLMILLALLISIQIGTGKLKSGLSYLKKLFLSGAFRAIAAFFAFLFVFLNLFSLYHGHIKRPDGPNIIIIVADALRADHLGAYGYSQPTSPIIDKFASQGLLFENVWANSPWTKPSVGSLFTSFYPHEHGAFFWTSILSDGCLTLAEFMKNSWYKTMAVQTNPAISKNYNFDQGFDYYEEKPLARGKEVTRLFGKWLARNKNRPFFVYLHYYDTHHPYNVPLEYSLKFGSGEAIQKFFPGTFSQLEIRTLTKFGLNQDDKNSIVRLYDGAINYFDEQFSSLLFMLKRYDILDNTIIILTSDHGEEFWEHGNYEHGHSVYDEVLRVPLIIGYGHNLSPERISAKYQLVDILPIIAQLSNIEPPSNIRGIDLTKGSRDGGRVVFAEGLLYGEEKKVVIRDSFKLIRNTGKIYPDTLEPYGFLNNYLSEKPKVDLELYDIKQDWKETNNLVKTLPDMTEKLNRLLDRIVLMNSGPSDLSRERVNQKLEDLKSLGYIH